MMSERELVRGNWYYYLRAGGKWHVFVYISGHGMEKIAKDLPSLSDAKRIAYKYAEFLEEASNAEVESDVH